MLAACGGDGASIDVDARCPLTDETYDAFSSASGPSCSDGEPRRSCYEGDLCRESTVCAFVTSTTTEAYCALLHAPYTAFSGAGGARCGSGDGAGSCFAGDRCREVGVCEAVRSATNGQPHAELFEKRYDAFSGAGGVRCGTGDGAGSCFAGDRCVEPGVCALVLNGLGGTVQAGLIGSTYTASAGAGGVRCGTGDGSGSCKPGDHCAAPGMCEVVLSAWTR